jgi:hypothetical protein
MYTHTHTRTHTHIRTHTHVLVVRAHTHASNRYHTDCDVVLGVFEVGTFGRVHGGRYSTLQLDV